MRLSARRWPAGNYEVSSGRATAIGDVARCVGEGCDNTTRTDANCASVPNKFGVGRPRPFRVQFSGRDLPASGTLWPLLRTGTAWFTFDPTRRAGFDFPFPAGLLSPACAKLSYTRGASSLRASGVGTSLGTP